MKRHKNLHVCIATRWSETLVLPVISDPDAGGCLVVVATSKRNPSINTNEAIRPAERFMDLLRTKLPPEARVVDVRVPSDDYRRALEEIKSAISWFDEDTIELGHIVLNVTGGQKQICFAALAAVDQYALSDKAKTFEILQIQPGPPPTFAPVVRPPDGRPPIAPDVRKFSLPEILSLRGLEIREATTEPRFPDASAIAMAECSTANFTTRFQNLGALNGIAKAAGAFDDERKRQKFPRVISLNRALIRGKGREFIDGLVGKAGGQGFLIADDDQLSIQSKEALDWLAGGWFEECCFIAARKCAGPEAEVYMNAHLGLVSRRDGASFPKDVREFDVVVWRDGLIYVIEAKTGVVQKRDSGSGINQDTLNKLSTIRQNIVGPFGGVALLNPRPMPNKPEAPGYDLWRTLRERANNENIDLSTGPALKGGMSGLEKTINRLFQ